MQLESILDVPLYNTNLRIMKFWSFLLQHNWRRYLCLIPYIMINTTQFLDVYYSTEPIDAIVRNAYIAVLFFNTILRAESEDKTIQKMLHETTQAARFISKVNLCMGTCSCIGFITYPLFATSKVLPFGMYVPGIDKYKSPFYQIFFALQITITPMGCCMYIPFTNLIVAFILFAILMCNVLQHKLKNLKGCNNSKAREVIVWCIKYQLKLIKYVDTLNDLTTHIYLVEFLAFGAMLCAMLFLLIIVETLAQMIIISMYIFMIFSQSVVMYYFANELYDQSLLVANAAYESNWFEFNTSNQKNIKLLILRSQKPCAVLIGKVYPMNLEMLQSLLNATYSYFTLLKRDVPIFTTSLRIMKFWAFLLAHNWRRYASLIPYTLLNTTQFMEIYFSTEPVDAIIRNAYIAVLFFNSTLRGVVLCLNRFGFEHVMETVRLLYIELKASDDPRIRKMLQETTKASMMVSKVNLVMGAFSVLGFLTYPIFSTTLPYGIYVPGINKYQSPYYEIFFVTQIILAPMGCCMFIPFTNLIVALILFAILMCKVLQHKLSNLKEVSNKEAFEVIVWSIKYQKKLISYVGLINNLTTHTFMIEFLAYGAMLCAMLFSLVIVGIFEGNAETLAQMIIISIYMFMIFAQSVVLYYFANELYDQSLLVAIAAYESNWFNFDVDTQKVIKLMILRSQKACAIMVGKVYPMNLELLQSLLNATYSYFTLLKRVYG
ncbi:hypothetical protein DOY81_000570 [Sarcophaga bullata]|nr:hypothetical protein DOY81_000570 [Sarcophaga bullata]